MQRGNTEMNRRLLTAFAAALLLLVLAGCGKNALPDGAASGTGSAGQAPSSGEAGGTGETAGGSESGQAAEPNVSVQVGPLQVGEAAQVGPLVVTLRTVEAIRQAAGLPDGYVYLMADLHIRNEGSAAYTINVTEHFRATTPEDKRAPYNMQASGQRSPRLQGTLDPGQSTEGWLGHLAKAMDGTYTYQFVHPTYGEATWEFPLQ